MGMGFFDYEVALEILGQSKQPLVSALFNERNRENPDQKLIAFLEQKAEEWLNERAYLRHLTVHCQRQDVSLSHLKMRHRPLEAPKNLVFFHCRTCLICLRQCRAVWCDGFYRKLFFCRCLRLLFGKWRNVLTEQPALRVSLESEP